MLENNIGFFSKSKNAEAMIAEVRAKIERAKQEMQAAIEKVKLIDQEENKEYPAEDGVSYRQITSLLSVLRLIMYVGYTFFAVNLDAWYFYLFLYM